MFIPEEEHDSHRVVEFVHLLEIGDLIDVAEINNGEILHAVGDFVEDFVLGHTCRREGELVMQKNT